MNQLNVFQDKKKENRWNLKANNGEIIADSSEGYVKKSDCEHGIKLVQQLSPEAKIEVKAKKCE